MIGEPFFKGKFNYSHPYKKNTPDVKQLKNLISIFVGVNTD
jgi:hypothetical protein